MTLLVSWGKHCEPSKAPHLTLFFGFACTTSGSKHLGRYLRRCHLRQYKPQRFGRHPLGLFGYRPSVQVKQHWLSSPSIYCPRQVIPPSENLKRTRARSANRGATHSGPQSTEPADTQRVLSARSPCVNHSPERRLSQFDPLHSGWGAAEVARRLSLDRGLSPGLVGAQP